MSPYWKSSWFLPWEMSWQQKVVFDELLPKRRKMITVDSCDEKPLWMSYELCATHTKGKISPCRSRKSDYISFVCDVQHYWIISLCLCSKPTLASGSTISAPPRASPYQEFCSPCGRIKSLKQSHCWLWSTPPPKKINKLPFGSLLTTEYRRPKHPHSFSSTLCWKSNWKGYLKSDKVALSLIKANAWIRNPAFLWDGPLGL